MAHLRQAREEVGQAEEDRREEHDAHREDELRQQGVVREARHDLRHQPGSQDPDDDRDGGDGREEERERKTGLECSGVSGFDLYKRRRVAGAAKPPDIDFGRVPLAHNERNCPCLASKAVLYMPANASAS